MNILLLGKTGLLGSEFMELLTRKFREKSGINFLAPDRVNFDVLDFEQVDDVLRDNRLDLIIYCVAYTDVERAETARAECRALNVEALENLLRYEIPIIHFSTDYVFNAGEKDEITENFPRNPLNYYGQTKLEAEKLLENLNKLPLLVPSTREGEVDKNNLRKWWNIRTSWLFGKGGKNFISTIITKARENKELEIVEDEIGRPTSAKDLAEFVFAEFIEKSPPSGHYHCQNTGEPVSWKNFAGFFLNLPLPKEVCGAVKIRGISAKNLTRKARRPVNSVLKNTKLKNKLRDWQEAVREFLS